MKSKILTSLAVLLSAFALVSCQRDNRDNGQKTVKIGISIPAADHGWTGGVVYWAERARKEITEKHPNVKVFVSTAKDSADQASGIENLLVRNIDALVILPNEPEPLTPICKEAVGQGVKLVVVDRNLTEDIMDLSVVGDNAGFGRVAAEQIVKTLNGKGKIALMEGILCQVNTDRVSNFKKVLEGYPEIEIVSSGIADWSTEKGLRLMETFLQTNPQLDAVWTGDDDVLIGALQAYRESKRSDLKVLLGGGGSKTIIKMILDGDPVVTQTVTYPPKMIYTATQRALDLLNGETPANKLEVIPAEVVDRSNAEANYFPDSVY